MTDTSIPSRIFDQLRSNVQAAGIAATEDDIAGMAEKGFLNRPLEFERAMHGLANDRTHDYLKLWADPSASQPAQAAALDAGQAESGAAADDLAFASISTVAELLRTRQLSPVELTEQVLGRIMQHEDHLNAFQLVLADQAREAARQAEREIASGAYAGPLHGVPLVVKDLMALAGSPTTAGSRILADNIADHDSTIVSKLRDAGAIIVGKTRMSEFAYSPGSNNAHYGPTRNPWNGKYDTGGSSSGSGAAVAAGLAYAGIGSDTGGSIRIPASYCGIVGLKPTFGRISLYGVVPLSWSLDHAGPLTRTVTDAALLLDALQGADGHDIRARDAAPLDLSALEQGVEGMRIGVLHDDGSGMPFSTDEMLAAWRKSLSVLEAAGAELVPFDMPELDALRAVQAVILGLEATAYHLPWLRARLDDYGPFMRQRILSSFVYGPTAYVEAQQARAALRARCDAIWERVDVLSTPAQPGTAPALDTPGSTFFTGPFNQLGWPAISMPTGLASNGLPLAMQLVGRPWDDITVLRVARAVEAGMPGLGMPPLT
jgi:aspartyl-tRNA(Asn)/glutamyl-tRNA(Gln) amidotransferase subunit A